MMQIRTIGTRINNLVKSACDFTEKIISSRLFLYLTFTWFILQSLYLALSVKVGIPPDEHYHLNFIKLFTENGWTPWLSDQEGYYILGEAVHTPFFLYHYLMSIPYHFIHGLGSADNILRILSTFIGVGSLWLTYRIANVIKVSTLVRNLSLFMLANTLMFVFINASISYDSLFIFLSLASILLMLQCLKETNRTRFLLLLLILVCGLLTKINFLPVAFIVVLVLLWKKKNQLRAFLRASLRSSNRKLDTFLAVFLLFFGFLFLQHYAYNLVRYHAFKPACDQVLTVEQCMQNGIYKRKLPPARPSFEPNSYQYIVNWIMLMQDRSYGILAHKNIDDTIIIKNGSRILLALSLFAIIRMYRKNDKELKILLLIVGFFILVLALKNYGSYARYGIFGIAVQGRYLFGVLPLIYLVSNHYILRLAGPSFVRAVFLLGVLFVFATASLPSYIYETSPDWRNDRAVKINESLKHTLQTIKP